MEALEQLKSVLCDPEGNVCISGSDGDRKVISDALESLDQQVAALKNERDEDALLQPRITMSNLEMASALAAAQAREAKLRDVIEKAGNRFCNAIHPHSVEGRTYRECREALALPTDDSALMERMKEEREQLIDDWTTTIATCYKSDDLLTAEQVVDLLCSSNKKADAIRSMT